MDNHKLRTPGLTRQIGFFSATIVVIANMVGTGVFTTSGFVARDVAHPVPLLLCWLVGGIFALCGALCYGELGSRFPRAGGDYAYLKQAFGPMPAFLSGWVSLAVGFSAPIAASAIAFSAYLTKAFSLPSVTLFTFTLFGRDIVLVSTASFMAVLAVIVLSLVHMHSVRLGSRVQGVLTVFKLAVIAAFIVGGFLVGRGSLSHFSSEFRVTSLVGGGFATSLIFISFAYSGWNAAAYLGGEIRNPGRNIPLSLFAGTLTVIISYLALNAVYIYALPIGEMRGVLEVGEKAASALFGDGTGRLLTGAIAVGLLSALSAMILTGPRVYYAMSRDGAFFARFGRVHDRRQTPVLAIVLQATISISMILTSSFEKLLLYIGFTLSLFSILTVIGLLRLKTTQKVAAGAYRTFGYPVTPLVFIAGNGIIVCLMLLENPATVFWGLFTIGIGAVFYWRLRPRKSAAHPGAVAIRSPLNVLDGNT